MKVYQLMELLHGYPVDQEVYFVLELFDDDKIAVVSIDGVHEADLEKKPIVLLISEYSPPTINNMN